MLPNPFLLLMLTDFGDCYLNSTVVKTFKSEEFKQDEFLVVWSNAFFDSLFQVCNFMDIVCPNFVVIVPKVLNKEKKTV